MIKDIYQTSHLRVFETTTLFSGGSISYIYTVTYVNMVITNIERINQIKLKATIVGQRECKWKALN